MWRVVLTLLLHFQNGRASLWRKGVVHFAINPKDYDIHSQEIIQSTLEEIEREICVKFFNIPSGFNSTESRVLYITNPGKRKACPPDKYNFSQPVVDMPIGYKCIDKKNIARIVVDMLRASIQDSGRRSSSFDLTRQFQELEDPSHSFLISPKDRNFINAHYHGECRSLSARVPLKALRSSDAADPDADSLLSEENKQYYKDRVWPLGILTYSIDENLADSADAMKLKSAMTRIELASCVVFQEVKPDDTIEANHLLKFAENPYSSSAPLLGFHEGVQTVSLADMVNGDPGHVSHTLNLLMRALGLPMVSNRPDRDNHVNIHWNNVAKGKELFLEQYPPAGWVRSSRLPYDFQSVTHAPANYACRSCSLGETTVEPAHDHLWSRTLSMGHQSELSPGDKLLLEVIYNEACARRYGAEDADEGHESGTE